MFKRGLPKTSPWRRYQKAQWLILLFNLAVACVAAIVAVWAPGLYEHDLTLWVAAGLIGIPNVIAGYWLGNFPCPRCGRPFFWSWSLNRAGQNTPYSSSCRNCGLPRWQDGLRGQAAQSEGLDALRSPGH